MQRLNYLSATIAHLQGVQKLIYFVVPVISIITLQAPVIINYWLYLVLFGALTLLSLTLTALNSRRTYHFFHTETFNFLSILCHTAGLWGIFKVQKKFAVSRKVTIRAERTWLKGWLWALVALSFVGLGRDSDLMLHHHFGGLVITTTLLICLQSGLLLSFLWSIGRYERGSDGVTIPHRPTFIRPSLHASYNPE